MKKIILFIVISLFIQSIFSQIKKFGKVSTNEFNAIENPDFKEANAVVLFKKRTTSYEYGSEKGWYLVTTIHERIKIINKEGFDRATKEISFYSKSNNTEEKVSIKAATFNLISGKIEKTKLKKSEIFLTKENKYWSNKKFTMPNVKEGSIIEWKYTLDSPHYHRISDVVFQYEIPILYMEATITIPEYFIFKTDVSKYYLIDVDKSSKNRNLIYSYRVKECFSCAKSVMKKENISLSETIFSIKQKNIKGLKNEPFVNNINNYNGKVKFEIVGTHHRNAMYKAYGSSWEEVAKTINESTNFGEELKKKKYFKKDLQALISNISNQNERIQVVFNFVKDKIKWNEYHDYYTHDGVKKAYKNGVGNVAEINLILVAMLRESGIDASPILVSTRSHGVPIFPTRKGFNYVIAGVELANETLLLDATEKYSTINNLPNRVLNWKGRILRKNESSAFIDLYPKMYNLEKNMLSLDIDDSGSITGNLRTTFNKGNAIIARNKLIGLSEEQLTSDLESIFTPIEISKSRIYNAKKLANPFIISLQFTAENQAENISNKMYFSPLFFLKMKENIFKSEERNLPIDFASAWLDSNGIQINIPEGYSIETLPKSEVFKTENNVGSFSYTISKKENKIILRTETRVNAPVIPANHYKELKDLYSKMVGKMNEKVVLIKN